MVEPKADLYPAMRASREYWDERHEAELAALRAEVLDLREQVSALESREVCTVAHDGDVTTCGYCQRDALRARVAELEAAGRAVIGCTDQVCAFAPNRCEAQCRADEMLRAALRASASAGASNTPVPDQFLPFRVEEQTGAYPHQNEWEVWTAGDDDTAFQVAVCNSQLMAEAIAHYGRELLQRAHPRQLSVQPSKGDE